MTYLLQLKLYWSSNNLLQVTAKQYWYTTDKPHIIINKRNVKSLIKDENVLYSQLVTLHKEMYSRLSKKWR